MAWTTISNALVAVGALPFATTMQALRDNPIAIANGNAGAPRIQTAAIQDSAVTTAKLASGERMNTTNVLGQTAGASVGAIGTYAFMRGSGVGPGITAGTTYAGSFLRYSGTAENVGATPAGTWRAMGTTTAENEATLFLRVS
jgi:hypothetical protein